MIADDSILQLKSDKVLIADDDSNDTTEFRNSSLFSIVFNTTIFMVGSLCNFVASYLIFNIIALFRIRDIIKLSFNNILNMQLIIIELMVMGNIFAYRFICTVTGTRIKQVEGTSNKYDNRGLLRYNDVHNQYWNGRKISYGDNMNSYSVISRVMPITKFLDINDEEIARVTDDIKPSIHQLQNSVANAESSIGRPDNVSFTEEVSSSESSASVGEVTPQKSYFSFHRRLKKTDV